MLFKNLYKYGRALNSHDLVKIIAIALVIIDHSGQYLLDDNLWCRMLGRGAAPLFFFLIGYVNRLHISPVLIAYGLILSFTGTMIWDHLWVNILINFILFQIILWTVPIESLSNRVKIVGFIGLNLLQPVVMPYMEYGVLGLLWLYSARLYALKSPQAVYWLIATTLSYLTWEDLAFQFYTNPLLNISFILWMVLLGTSLIFYRFKEFTVTVYLRLPGLLLSRYSLEIYFYHLILLQAFYLSPLSNLG